jgi:hypothetical protein
MRALLLTLSIACAATTALAAGPAPPAELQAARKALAAAAKKQDRKAIAEISRFPLAQRVYRSPNRITEAQFLSSKTHFSNLFGDGDAELVACIDSGALGYQAKKLDFPGSPWFLDCNGHEYYFGLVNGQWRFTSYMNINE